MHENLRTAHWIWNGAITPGKPQSEFRAYGPDQTGAYWAYLRSPLGEERVAITPPGSTSSLARSAVFLGSTNDARGWSRPEPPSGRAVEDPSPVELGIRRADRASQHGGDMSIHPLVREACAWLDFAQEYEQPCPPTPAWFLPSP